jgi:hypothetical protein
MPRFRGGWACLRAYVHSLPEGRPCVSIRPTRSEPAPLTRRVSGRGLIGKIGLLVGHFLPRPAV